MISNDEDTTLFLEELAELLTKYHYKISTFQLRRFHDPEMICFGFTGDNINITPIFLERKYIKYKDE